MSCRTPLLELSAGEQKKHRAGQEFSSLLNKTIVNILISKSLYISQFFRLLKVQSVSQGHMYL